MPVASSLSVAYMRTLMCSASGSCVVVLPAMSGAFCGVRVMLCVTSWLAAVTMQGGHRELDEFGVEFLAEPLELFVACAVPFVDDLVVVCDDEDVFELCSGEFFDDAVLCGVRVLELVDHPVRVGSSVSCCDGWVRGDEAVCLEEEGVEVECVEALEFFFVERVGSGVP